MGNPVSLHDEPTTGGSTPAGEWLLTEEERRSLCSTRRFFHLGLAAAAVFTLALAAWIVWFGAGQYRGAMVRAALALAFAGLLAAAGWCAGRARIIGRDIRNGRVDARWGRVTRIFRRLRVAEIEGVLFPLQITPVPNLRPGERVRVRFAPRSRIAFGIRTLRDVVAAERLAGRSPCPGVLAALGEEPTASPRPDPGAAGPGSV
ncbi:MAG: hypothetical protein HY713_01265 [candidate division NC10 bacterium]|nr:hypothetical protein [candidate division NC10 bacterium]